jgi:hypothetical protein
METSQEKQLRVDTVEAVIGWFGGLGKLKAMVNARGFVSGTHGMAEASVHFRFSGSKKASMVVVTYERAHDLYRMEFFKGSMPIMVQGYGLLQGSDLRKTFEEFTGLYLSI